MALTIYGSTDSRTMRVLWAAREIGVAFHHVPHAYDDPVLKQPAFLRVNPAGAIPAIDDGGFRLAESLAIILYLAKKYGAPPLYPTTLEGEAEVWRWTLWAQVELEPWVQGDRRWQAVRDAIGERWREPVERSLNLMETALAGRDWLLGPDFTAADLTVGAILSPSRAAKLPLDRFPRLQAWQRRCYSRPAAAAVRGGLPS